MSALILIIGDVDSQHGSIEYTVAHNLGYRAITAHDCDEAIRIFQSSHLPQPNLVLMDMDVVGQFMINAICEIKAHKPHVPMIVVTHYGEDAHTAKAIKAGASDFLTKPVELERLRISLRNALMIQTLNQEVTRLQRQYSIPGEAPNFTKLEHLSHITDAAGTVRSLKVIEEEAILAALRHADGCITRAARNLGIGRSTLYRRGSDLELGGYIPRANHTTRPIMRTSAIERS